MKEQIYLISLTEINKLEKKSRRLMKYMTPFSAQMIFQNEFMNCKNFNFEVHKQILYYK